MHRFAHRIISAAALTGLLVAAGAFAEQPSITLLGSGFTGTPFHITGNLVAESDSLYETIRDYSDPAAPVVAGWMDHSMDAYMSDVVYGDGLMVGLTRADGLGTLGFIVADVSNPSAPVEYGTFAGMGFDSGWMRGRAFTASSQELLVTYDLSVPTAPAMMSFASLGSHAGSRWPVAVGNTLFLIDHENTVRALDVTDALHPASLATPALACDRIDALAAGDGVLYALVATAVGLADERLELVTCDVADSAAPVETDRQLISSGTGALGRSLISSGDLLVAATADGRVCSFGLGSPAHPAAGWTLLHDCTRLVVTPSAILIREGRDLVRYARTAYDVAPAAPVRDLRLLSLITVAGEGPLQIVQYRYATNKFGTVDVSDPYRPRLGPITTIYGGGVLQYAGGIGALSSTNSSRLVDFADPAHPIELGMIWGPDARSQCHLVSRNIAAFENPITGLPALLYDITNAAQPVPAGLLDELVVPAADGNLLVGATGSQVRLYDVSSLAAPTLLGSLPNPGTVLRAVFWRGHLYTMATRSGNLRSLDTYDVSDTLAPVMVSSVPMSFLATRLDLHGNRLYAQARLVAQVYDLTDPAAPALLGTLNHNSPDTGFAVNGNVTTVSGDLLTVRNNGLSASSAPPVVSLANVRLEPASPNPFNPSTSLAFSIVGEHDLTLSVYDVRGRHLADLARGSFTTGTHTVTWDGKDGSGSPAAAGVYLVRLHGTGVEAVQAVTLLK